MWIKICCIVSVVGFSLLSAQSKDSTKTKNIEEVVLKAETNAPKLNNGNVVLKIANNKEYRTSSNLYDVLRRTPGVYVDQEGAITFGGQITPVIFINGKTYRYDQ